MEYISHMKYFYQWRILKKSCKYRTLIKIFENYNAIAKKKKKKSEQGKNSTYSAHRLQNLCSAKSLNINHVMHMD